MLVDLHDDLGNAIAQAVVDEYRRPSNLENKALQQFRNARPKETETTVLAGLVKIEPNSRPIHQTKRQKVDEKPQLDVLAVCTGMKVTPASRIERGQGRIVHDSHAEILCLRLFNWLVLQEMNAIRENNGSDLLIQDHVTEQFKFKHNLQFALYISEIPCGDASTENLRDSFLDQTDWNNLEETEGIFRGRNGLNMLGRVRTKPGRKDSPISYSKSCSDKLCLKQFTSMLSSLVYDLVDDPPYLSFLVLPKEKINTTALERCFRDRIKMTPEVSSYYHPLKVLATDLPCQFTGSTPSNLAILYCPPRSYIQVLNKGVRNGCPAKKGIEYQHQSDVSREKLAELATKLAPHQFKDYKELKRRASVSARKKSAREAIGHWGKSSEDNFALSHE
ncbi:hypothetical protein KL949_000526 [Ogataea haglerorum]|nr:hypothetical protein KL913_000240 [Ogataea haglerorum]KAG7723476.1 hypothetical protein KL949_000526 [Ogataea haglerorum]KAG7771900.1 hypothetical protein KL931_000240 [Ogataea haglerorum]